jgi:hypothetical protein
MVPKGQDDAAGDLIGGNYLVRFEPRTLDHIRELGANDDEDDRKFAAVARLSEINLGLYRTFMQPLVRIWANEGLAKWMRQFHPLRLQYEMFSNANPFMRPLKSWVEDVKKNRQPVSNDNVFWQVQERFAGWMETSLDAYRDVRDHTSEALFDAVYGSPLVQALLGLRASDRSFRTQPGKDALHKALVAQRIEELTSRIADGGPREAAIRALLYIRMPEGVVDERAFNLLQRIRDEAGGGLTVPAFKKLVREQFLMLQLDERRSIEAIPAMLARDPKLASRMEDNLHRVIDAVGLRSKVGQARLAEVETLFEIEEAGTSKRFERRETALASGAPARPQPERRKH